MKKKSETSLSIYDPNLSYEPSVIDAQVDAKCIQKTLDLRFYMKFLKGNHVEC